MRTSKQTVDYTQWSQDDVLGRNKELNQQRTAYRESGPASLDHLLGKEQAELGGGCPPRVKQGWGGRGAPGGLETLRGVAPHLSVRRSERAPKSSQRRSSTPLPAMTTTRV